MAGEFLVSNFKFLDIPNPMYQGSLTTEKRSDRKYEVEFRDVSFRYPDTEQWALRHINLKFQIGKRLAVVGMNGSGKTTFIKLLEFRDVSFRYPDTEQWALRHINLKFQIGKRLAVVGMNGSGKTTFIKLLCRLYDPTEGQIFLNGIDIRKYKYDDYINIFSVVFQDFQLLSLPLGEMFPFAILIQNNGLCGTLI